MPVSDYNKEKPLEVNNNNDSGSTIGKAQPILLTDGDDSTTGTGDVVIDFSNISGAEDIAVYDQNDNLLDYEIENLDTNNNTAVLWAYNDWTRDSTVQAKVAYGNNSANTDRQNVTGTWANTGQDAFMVYHLQDDPLTATDSTSNNNNGAVNGAVSTNGQFDKAASFDGNDDFIESNLQVGSSGIWTVSMWIKPNTVSGIFDAINLQGAGGRFYAGIDNGSSNFRIALGDTFRSTQSNFVPSTSEWTYFVMICDGPSGQAKQYMNGSLVDSFSFGSNSGSSNLVLGADAKQNRRYWDGDIDEIKVYNRILERKEIVADYDASPKGGQTFFSQQAAQTTGGGTEVGSVAKTSNGVIQTVSTAVIDTK